MTHPTEFREYVNFFLNNAPDAQELVSHPMPPETEQALDAAVQRAMAHYPTIGFQLQQEVDLAYQLVSQTYLDQPDLTHDAKFALMLSVVTANTPIRRIISLSA